MKGRIQFITSAILVLLFSYTAFSKWFDRRRFAYEMHNQPLPGPITDMLIWGLPPLEMTIVLLLLFTRTRWLGFILALGLMWHFMVYNILILLGAFHRVPCACGGVISLLNWREHLVLNIGMVGITIWGIWSMRKTKQHA
ncbi:MAG TPA: MauE/DoxX family redox-associated membrane protein [Sediminibacterium sp.]|nr:MauE/DoxX family redox-associated membrane protein [Sediminibacterium sp.]